MVSNMIGQTISHYRILSKLGKGGMGVVYKAEDMKLKRSVALKFLAPELTQDPNARARFVHEAEAVAALAHPNICTIFEIDEFEGQSFIAMECCEGETLNEKIARGPLKLEDAIDIVRQVSLGLAKAHNQGIIHRDIKPANIMITLDGQLKVMDFGLAKAAGATQLTKTRATVGTLAYMSPEQAAGKSVDHRSDIFSLGVVMYELITGKHPFPGDQEAAILYSIVNTAPEAMSDVAPDIPLPLQQVVERAMAKDTDDRYQRLEDLVTDLESLSKGEDATLASLLGKKVTARRRRRLALYAGLAILAAALVVGGIRFLPGVLSSGTRISSLAILPLANLTNDPEQDIIVDVLTSELIARLGRVGSLDVISSRSVMQYKGTEKSLTEIARELGVEALLEGAVQLVGERIRLTVELLDPARDELLWGDTYSGALSDVLTLQGDLVLGMCRSIETNLSSRERSRLAVAQDFDPAVHKAYLMGKRASRDWTGEAWKKGAEHFNQAIDLDVAYAPAYAGLSRCYGYMGWFYEDQDYNAMQKAAALEALELDDSLAEAHVAMANYLYRKQYDWVAAEEEFERALELEPGNDLAHQDYGIFLYLSMRFDECFPHLIKAKDLDPLNIERHRELGLAYVNSGRPAEAIPYYLKMRERFPNYYYTEWHLSAAYSLVGMHEQAVALIDSLVSENPGSIPLKAPIYAQAGRVDEAFLLLDGLVEEYGYEAASEYAQLHDMVGQYDEALAWAKKVKPIFLMFLNIEPLSQSMREHPGYQELMRSIGHPAY